MWIKTLIPWGSHCKYSSSWRERLWSKCGCVIDITACFLSKLSTAIPRRQPSGPMYSTSSSAWASYARHWENKILCAISSLKGFGVGNHDTLWIIFIFCVCACYVFLNSTFILWHGNFYSEVYSLRCEPWNFMSQIFFWGLLQKESGIA